MLLSKETRVGDPTPMSYYNDIFLTTIFY